MKHKFALSRLTSLGLVALFGLCLIPQSTLAKKTVDLTGEWTAKAEISYMKLQHKKESVTGIICEAKGHDCMKLKGVTWKKKHLRFHYTFGKKVANVALHLTSKGNLKGKLALKGTKMVMPLLFKKGPPTKKKPKPKTR